MTDRDPNATPAFTVGEANAFLSGSRNSHSRGSNSELDSVVPVIDALRVAARAVPVPSRVDVMAAQLAAVASDAMPAGNRTRTKTTLKRSPAMKARARIASATGAALALALGTAGVATAADDAIPGDPLYDLNLAFETIGINDGGLDERVEESAELAEQGDDEAALEHLADSLEEEGDEETAEELRNAAQAVLSGGSENSLETRTAVAEMLQWMADTDLEGREFGQGVAERARAINGNKHADDEVVEDDETVVEDDATVEDDELVEDDTKGGPPEGKGKPDHAGPPEGKGKPDHAGPPEGKGKPSHAGPPEGKGKP